MLYTCLQKFVLQDKRAFPRCVCVCVGGGGGGLFNISM